jgi:hypothetical protein
LEGGLHCATNPVILPSRRQAESRMAGDSNPHYGLTPRASGGGRVVGLARLAGRMNEFH